MKEYVSYYDCIKEGNKIWFSNNLYNGLFNYDIENKKTQMIDVFPNEKWGRKGLHQKVILYGRKLFFFPGNSDYIHIFDIDSYQFEFVKLGYERDVAGVGVVDNKAYIFPKYSQDVPCIFDMKSYDITEAKGLENLYKKNIDKYLVYSIVQDGNTIIIPKSGSNEIVYYDCLSQNIIDVLNIEINDISTIELYKNSLWICKINDNSVYRLKKDSTCTKYIFNGLINNNMCFLKNICGRLICFSQKEGKVFFFNDKDDEFQILKIDGEKVKILDHVCSKWSIFSGATNIDNQIFINQFSTNTAIYIKNNDISYIEMFTNKSQTEYIFEKRIQKQKIVNESDTFSLEVFLNYLYKGDKND